jgi:D-lactate dehydrogenase
MKIAFFEVEDWEKEHLKKEVKGDLVFFNDELNSETIKSVRDADVICVFIYSQVRGNILSKFDNLKAVVTRSTGFDHIDLEFCKKKKIKVFNVPNYGENTVAEHTFALILSLSRKIHKSYEKTVRGNFSLEGLRGFDLKDKTLGIVGVGSIGKNVIRIAKGFDMDIIAYDVVKDNKFAKKHGFKYVSFNDLLKKSDIISFHCPYNKHTHHMINKDNVFKIKKGAFVINTSRGNLIDSRALINALVKKHLGGAGLDVLEEENLIKEEVELLSKKCSLESLENLLENHILITFDNVIITPHNAFNSEEALNRILDVTIENISNVGNKNSKNLVRLK